VGEVKDEYVSHRSFAIIYLGLGEHEAAIAELERADQDGEPFDYIKNDHRYDHVSSNSRFQELLRRHGLS
jgi:hypothetical protein